MHRQDPKAQLPRHTDDSVPLTATLARAIPVIVCCKTVMFIERLAQLARFNWSIPVG